jgi:long-chain fatty acid transport protein
MSRNRLPLYAFALLLAVSAAEGRAGNGHILHGIGAVDAALGGAGVALPNDTLGALNSNPALLTRMDGHRLAFSAEFADAQNAVSSQVGPFAGRTEESGDVAVIPAFGWTRHREGSRIAYGMGFLGLAGFGVDYPQDPTNPILAPQPQGFGRVTSRYEMLKIPFVLAWQVNDALSLGVSLNAGRATLTADPAGFAAPDCSGPTTCFVPRVSTDSSFGYGLQVGVLYRIDDVWSLGASYATKQDFDAFEWNSQVANPNLPTFGQARRITFDLDSPATAAVGLAVTPNARLSVALDAKWVNYADADGFGGFGTDAMGNATGLGWEDIAVYSLGVQYRPTARLALRLGFNRAENPIPDELTFFNVVAPAIFEDHVSAGLGFQLYENLDLNLGYYKALENEASGPFVSPAGPVPGTRVTNEMSIDSGLLTLSFHL